MVIIPEGSICSNFTSKCLNDWRNRNESLAKRKTTPNIPVIPRFYNKKYLLAAINKLSPNVCKIIDHEDSILYYYVFKETQDTGFSEKHIFNNDPDFFELLHKAYLYGKNNKDTKNLVIPKDILLLIYKLNKTTFDIKELGLGKGYIIQIIRGVFYELGKLFGE